MKTYKFKIENLDCANCANEMERALERLQMIENVRVNFMTQRLTFELTEGDIEEALQEIRKIIKKVEPDVTIEEV